MTRLKLLPDNWESNMLIDFDVLEKALAPLRDVGNAELTFEVEDGDVLHEVTVRPLLPSEETLVQRQAQSVLEGKSDKEGRVERYAMLDFFDVFRRESLAYAIVQVNDLDLRNVEYVATGEKTTTGKAVRVPKNVAMRKLLAKWSRAMLMAAFGKYGELLSQIEKDTENVVESEPSDLEAEIQRCEKRLSDLKAERTRRAAGDSNITAEQVRAINDADVPTREMNRKALQQAPTATERVQEALQDAPGGEPPQDLPFGQEGPSTSVDNEEEWATFDDIPSGKDLNDDPEPKVKPIPEVVVSNEEPPRYADVVQRPDSNGNTTLDPLGGVMDSFGDPDDPEIVAAEERRLAIARRQYAQEQARLREDFGEEDDDTPAPRVPPHLRGQRPEMEVGVSGGQFRAADPRELQSKGLAGAAQQIDETAAIQAAEQRAAKRGDVDGMAIHPTETLSARGRGRKKKGTRINRRSSTAPTNTKFRAPGK